MGPDTSYMDEQILQLREEDENVRVFANELAELVCAVLGCHEVRIRRTRDAYVAWQCCGTDRQIARLEAQRSAQLSMLPLPFFPQGYSESPEERMICLIQDRDGLVAELEQAERGLAALPVEGISDVFEASIIGPMRRNLQFKELEISTLQKQIEYQRNTEGAATPGPRETKEGSP